MYKIIKFYFSGDSIIFSLLTNVHSSIADHNRLLLEEREIKIEKINEMLADEKGKANFHQNIRIIQNCLMFEYFIQDVNEDQGKRPLYCSISAALLRRKSKLVVQTDDFVSYVMNQVTDLNVQGKKYFRGESRLNWTDITPGSTNNFSDDKNIIVRYDYDVLTKEFLTLNTFPLPKLFRKNQYWQNEAFFIEKYKHKVQCNDNKFITLSDMQHFGMPTRLLDVTSNFLVALFFSLDNFDQDGAVFRYDTKRSTLRVSEKNIFIDFIISISFCESIYGFTDLLKDLVFKYNNLNDKSPSMFQHLIQVERIFPVLNSSILSSLGNFECGINYLNAFVRQEEKTISEIFWKLWSQNDLFLLDPPPYLNERIKNQAGKFLLFTDKYISNDHVFTLPRIQDTRSIRQNPHKIIIPCEFKRIILRDLIMKFGIDESFIYPQKDYIAKSIMTNFDLNILD